MGISDLLKKGAMKNTDTAKKSTTPVVQLPDTEENRKAMEEWSEAKEKEKTAEATRKQQEEILKPLAMKAQEDYCRKEAKFVSSCKVQVGKCKPLTFIQQNKYSDISGGESEELKNLFGKRFLECFKMNTEVKLSEKAMADVDSVLAKIVKAVGGEDKFLELFDVEQTYKPTEKMHEGRLFDAELGKLYNKAKDKGLLKPYSPSFRA